MAGDTARNPAVFRNQPYVPSIAERYFVLVDIRKTHQPAFGDSLRGTNRGQRQQESDDSVSHPRHQLSSNGWEPQIV